MEAEADEKEASGVEAVGNKQMGVVAPENEPMGGKSVRMGKRK